MKFYQSTPLSEGALKQLQLQACLVAVQVVQQCKDLSGKEMYAEAQRQCAGNKRLETMVVAVLTMSAQEVAKENAKNSHLAAPGEAAGQDAEHARH